MSHTLAKVMLLLLLVGQCFTVPYFIKVGWPKRSTKSTILKCTSSLFFILTAVFSCQLGAGFTNIAIFMIIGFIASLIGDFFLDLELTDKNIFLGIVFFFTAHLFYLISFINVGKNVGHEKLFTTPEIIAIVAIIVMAGATSLIMKMDMRKLFIPVALYALVISFMFVKAITTGIYVLNVEEYGIFASLPLWIGSGLFVTSDLILSMMFFAGKNTKNMRMWNLITYFAGQMLMAYSLIRLA